MVTTALSAANDFARAVKVLPDGKLLVGGNAVVSGSIQLALARYLANGTLDSTFNSGGFRTYDLGSGDDVCEDMAIGPDGKIVMAGANAGATDDFAVLRCLSDGTPDTSFGVNGVITSSFGSSNDVLSAVVVQPDGKIVVGGQSYNGSKYVFAMVRYTVTGGLDTSFGGGGVSTSFGSGNDAVKALALQPDGKILAGGYSFQTGSNDMAFARYLPNGTLDTTFYSAGKRIVSFVSGNDFCTGMALQPDGRVVCVGYASNGTNDDMAVLRLSPDGTLDTTFDGDGKVALAPGSQADQLYAAALTQDGNIVAAGLSQNASSLSQFAVVRLLGGPNDLLVNGGFEANEFLGGGSISFGDWGEGSAMTVGTENGITPYEGARMAGFFGPLSFPGATESEIRQFVNLSAYASEIGAGNLSVTVTSRVNRVAGSANTEFSLYLSARSGSTASFTTLDSKQETVFSDSDPATWQLLSNTFTIRPERHIFWWRFLRMGMDPSDSTATWMALR